MPVYWSSKRQGVIALSSAEAEMYAGGEAIKWFKHIIYLLEEIGVPTEMPYKVYSDSKSLIDFASSGGQRTGMKHIDLRMGWIQDMTNDNELMLKYVKGSANGADILTKLVRISIQDTRMVRHLYDDGRKVYEKGLTSIPDGGVLMPRM